VRFPVQGSPVRRVRREHRVPFSFAAQREFVLPLTDPCSEPDPWAPAADPAPQSGPLSIKAELAPGHPAFGR
jgi:hypothetical protein